ncbi:MAG: FMN-binding negative transcriptional regulator [Proteobacteria bacterium]|nr:FMN-binding negative transcriptional regulator [Pseudomonadota bacterium]
MYVPPKFSEEDRDTLYGVIRQYEFALLISETDEGPVATHLPFRLEGDVLVAHMARANPHWKSFAAGKKALVVFQGPHCYVSPRWYEAAPSVPTWNYVAVHVYGVATLIENPDEVRDGQAKLVDQYEQGGWRLEDQPEDYMNGMLRAIVSFKIPIARIEGKFKLSQNKSAEDRRAVIAELQTSDDPLARDVGALMVKREG